MGKVERFEDYEIWKQARILCQEIYLVTGRSPFCDDHSLKKQIRKSGGSVMDNIAEGHERGGNREFIHFLGISRGSCGEVRSQLYRASDQHYITPDEFHTMYGRSNKISAGIANLIKYLKNSDDKGFKFH